tara:strand:+ start:346 stop:651 length:306 start_codon:yes stop_codon:yes gene_type:complete
MKGIKRVNVAFVLTLVVCLIGGCASAKQTYSSDGEIAHSLNCSGTARNWGMCYAKAGEICGSKGYDVLTKEGEQGGVASASSSNAFASSLHFRTMTVACKK